MEAPAMPTLDTVREIYESLTHSLLLHSAFSRKTGLEARIKLKERGVAWRGAPQKLLRHTRAAAVAGIFGAPGLENVITSGYSWNKAGGYVPGDRILEYFWELVRSVLPVSKGTLWNSYWQMCFHLTMAAT